jgi:iron complex outermembrane recepter protein
MAKSCRLKLLTSTIIGIVAGGAASASSAQPQPPNGTPSSSVEEIAITGSRIQRTGMTTPTPVTVMDAATLSVLSPDQLIDSLRQMPQLFDSARPDFAGAYGRGTAGSSLLNMRGLGSNRTLVLLNGRRVVPSSKVGAVDINLFPEAMISRMEMVTGGASAAYGSDAVTGVTNFILNTNFTGVDTRMQTGDTSLGDRSTQEFSLALGKDFGPLHIQASLEYFHSDALNGHDNRDWYQDWAIVNNPSPTGPRRLTLPHVGSTYYTNGGLITAGPLKGKQFLRDGSLAPFNAGTVVSGSTGAGGDGANVDRQNEMFPEVERKIGFVYADYNFSEDSSVFIQGVFGRNDVPYRVSELALYRPASEATIFSDNAFLSESVRQQMAAAGVKSFPFGRYSSLEDWQDIEGTRNDTASLTVGLDHNFSNGWHLSGYYQSGETEQLTNSRTSRLDRAYRALDSVISPSGKIVCRSTLSNPNDGCVPLNLFGIGKASPEAVEYLMGWRYGTSVVEEDAAELMVDGELFPGWGAGPVFGAAGVNWRQDNLTAGYTDEASIPATIPPGDKVGYKGLPSGLNNLKDVFMNTEMLTSQGGYSVKEVFAEVVMPIVADQAYAQNLNATVSTRYAEYSGSGGVLAWKGGVDWNITDPLRLRLTRSRDTRAANLGERFDFLHDPFVTIDDPWAKVVGVNPLEGADVGGNPSVTPELSDTITFGFVYRPGWLPNFNLSIDKYRVKIKSVITQLGNQTIVDQCFREGAFCYLVKRNPVTGHVLSVNNTFQNLDQATVEGIDLEARYSWELDGGSDIDILFLAGNMTENSLTNSFGNKIEKAGQGTLTKWTGTTSVSYRNGPFSLGLSSRYIGSSKLNLLWVEGVDIDNNDIDSRNYFNLQAGYEMENALGGVLNFFGNVQNLLDRDPPWAGSTLSTWAGARHTNSNFDMLGRRFTVGMRYQY